MMNFDPELTKERWDYWVKLPSWSASEAIFLLISMEPDATDWEKRNIGPLFKAGAKNSAIENHFLRVGLIGNWPYLSERHPPKLWVEEFLKVPGEILPFPLPDGIFADSLGSGDGYQDAGSWPWGDYETELLRKLAEAAERFWVRYDPADNTTAPTNSQVVEWLKGRGVAERTAEIMATILRADGLPTGPRK